MEFIHDKELRDLITESEVKAITYSDLITEMTYIRELNARKLVDKREVPTMKLDIDSYVYGQAEGMRRAYTDILVAISTIENRPKSNYVKDAVVSILLDTYVHQDTGIELTDEELLQHEERPINNVINKMEYLFIDEMQELK